MDVCLVTGSNSGIGRATALHLARNGYKVHATMRNLDKGASLLEEAAGERLPLVASRLDVMDAASIAAAVERIEKQEGRIDVLVNNAGLPSACPVETLPEQEHRDVMEANYWGAVRLTQRVLPGMRQRRRGAIVNVTSILGRLALVNQSAYCASKFALEGFSEVLAQEVAPLGIRVVIMEPGVVASAIFGSTPPHYDKESPYKAAMRRNGRFYGVGIPSATPAEEIGATILEALRAERPKLRYVHGWGAHAVARRAELSDEEYIAMSTLDDEGFYARLRDTLGLDLTRKVKPA